MTMFTLELTPGEINVTLALIHYPSTDYRIALYAGESFITSSLKECVLHKSLNSVVTNIALYDVELNLAAIAVMKRSLDRLDERGHQMHKSFTITINRKDSYIYPDCLIANIDGLDFMTYNQYKDRPDYTDLMFSGTWNPKTRWNVKSKKSQADEDWEMMVGH